jgi:hypothetical protein
VITNRLLFVRRGRRTSQLVASTTGLPCVYLLGSDGAENSLSFLLRLFLYIGNTNGLNKALRTGDKMARFSVLHLKGYLVSVIQTSLPPTALEFALYTA